jgi:hypothetical protein
MVGSRARKHPAVGALFLARPHRHRMLHPASSSATGRNVAVMVVVCLHHSLFHDLLILLLLLHISVYQGKRIRFVVTNHSFVSHRPSARPSHGWPLELPSPLDARSIDRSIDRTNDKVRTARSVNQRLLVYYTTRTDFSKEPSRWRQATCFFMLVRMMAFRPSSLPFIVE